MGSAQGPAFHFAVTNLYIFEHTVRIPFDEEIVK